MRHPLHEKLPVVAVTLRNAAAELTIAGLPFLARDIAAAGEFVLLLESLMGAYADKIHSLSTLLTQAYADKANALAQASKNAADAATLADLRTKNLVVDQADADALASANPVDPSATPAPDTTPPAAAPDTLPPG